MGILDILLNKGGAGVSMSRPQTVERLNPILRAYYPLFHAYDALIAQTSDAGVKGTLEGFQRTTRTDIGKVAETILSCGGVAYNGTDLDPAAVRFDDDAVTHMRDQEEAFHKLVEDELKENHQIRTRAILNVVRENSKGRLEYLRGGARKAKR